jgi:mRNA-degrading endonuclease toxin of MazEF toxin-antitoxin module
MMPLNDAHNWNSVIVVPLSTSAAQARRGPTVVPISSGSGLNKPSAAIYHQITILDRAKLLRKIGALPVDTIAQVEAGVKAVIDVD